MYGQFPCTPINEFVHRLFCESKIPRSLIIQQEFFVKWFLPGFLRPGKVKQMQMLYLFGSVIHNKLGHLHISSNACTEKVCLVLLLKLYNIQMWHYKILQKWLLLYHLSMKKIDFYIWIFWFWWLWLW